MKTMAQTAERGRLDWPRTLAAKGPQSLTAEHLRRQAAPAGPARLHCIVLDGSGSMRRSGGFARAKGLAQRLVEQAARAGERVALLSLTGGRVQLAAPPQPARRATAARLAALGSGGGTPLAEALAQAGRLLRQARRRHAGLADCLWLLTDGRTLDRPPPPDAARVVIVDFDVAGASPSASRARGRAAQWAADWGAEYHPAPGALS